MTFTFVEFDTRVPTWRTKWPAEELARRGYNALFYAGGERPPFDPRDEVTFIVHFVNKAFYNPDGTYLSHLGICAALKRLGGVVVSYDDNWDEMLSIQGLPAPREVLERIVAKPVDELTEEDKRLLAIPALSKEVHRQIPELTAMADKVIVSTPRLVEVYGQWNSNVELVPNYLPEWVFDLPPLPPVERVAWMGDMYVHGAADWNMMRHLAPEFPPMRLIGSGRAAAEMLRTWGARDVIATETIVDQRHLYREMGSAVAAMIPLGDTPFGRGKSWTKPLEFMARGVQPYGSTHAEYLRLDEATGAMPTFDTPEALVEAVNRAWDERPDGSWLPANLRDRGMTMEELGGDAWEKALLS